MLVKTCPVTVKAAGDPDGAEEGVFEAIVATYDVDTIGDQIFPGAFKDTIAEWEQSGSPIPVVWSHKADDPDYHIGYVEKAEERPEGLWVRGRLDLDEAKSRKVYKLLKGRRISQMSFAYDEIDARPAGEKAAAGARKELHRLKVYEVGPCMIGMNQRTSLLDVKSNDAMPLDFKRISERMADAMASTWPETVTVQTLKSAEPERVLSPDQTAAFDRLGKMLDQLDAEYAAAEVDTKAAPPGLTTPKPIVARIRKLVAAAQALLDAVEPGDSNAKQATPSEPASESPAVKATDPEPAPTGTASARLRTDLAVLLAEADTYTD